MAETTKEVATNDAGSEKKAAGKAKKEAAGKKKEAAAKKEAATGNESATKKESVLGSDYEPRLQKYYRDVVVPKLNEQFGYKNRHSVPRITKIVLNMGVGESTGDSKKAQIAADDLALIAGQKPVVTRAENRFKTGDRVTIEESKPISKTKRWVVVSGDAQAAKAAG